MPLEYTPDTAEIDTADRSLNEKPLLPTAKTIASGVLANASAPQWLKKPDKYRLHCAVEALIAAGYTADEVLKAIGIDRTIYYSAIWFTDSEAAAFEDAIVKEGERRANSGNEQLKTKGKKPPNAQEKLDRVEQVDRLRYVEGMNFNEACDRVGVRPDRYYAWREQMPKLRKIVARQARGEHVDDLDDETPRTPRRKKRRGTLSRLDVDPDTLEERKVLVDHVHTLVVSGVSLTDACHSLGFKTKAYHQWVSQIEREQRSNESPLALWKEWKEEGQNPDILTRFIKHFEPTAKRIAYRFANRIRTSNLFDVDEDVLAQTGLEEGIWKNMDKYDPERGTPIVVYFTGMIYNRIQDEIRRQDFVSRDVRARIKAKNGIKNRFYMEHGRYPHDEEELRSYIGIDADEKQQPNDRVPSRKSLDEPMHRNNGQYFDRNQTRHDYISSSDARSNDRVFAQQRELVASVLDKIFGEERKVLELYYLQGLTMKEAGAQMYLSESRVSQLHTAAISNLQRVLRENAEFPAMKTVK